MRSLVRILIGTAIVLGGWSAPLPARAAPAAGQTYTVNSTLDEPDADPTNGICSSTPSGLCTLRAAIMESNFATGPNTILLPAGTYTITRPGYDNGDLVGSYDISHDVTLQGAGSAATIVDGNGAVTGDRVFQVLDTTNDVTLSGLTIRNGNRQASAGAPYDGGGLHVEGNSELGHNTVVHLSDVILEGNTASRGGALDTAAASGFYSGIQLDLNHVIVRGNTGTFYGGGLRLDGHSSALIKGSQIYSNTSLNGGGLWLDYASLELDDSTVSGNVAGQDGGGIYSTGDSNSLLTLVNSTVSGNVAREAGGGLYAFADQTQLLNATIASNQVHYHIAIQPGLGGGVYLTHTAVLKASNSIIANNSRMSDKGAYSLDDCSSQDTTGGLYYNLFRTMDNCILILSQIGTIEGLDPLLGPLQDNGGATQTQALLPGSPAIDAGDPAGCSDGAGGILIADQRGAPRPVAGCDMGAYEVVPEADLSVGQRDSPDPARVGALLTYTLAVTNTGPALATSVVLTDTPPLSATLWAATPNQGSCVGTVTITCDLGDLASGSHITVTVAVTATGAGPLTNVVTVSSNEFDPALADNSASETTAVAPQADLAVSQRDSPDPARMSAPLTYTIGLTNAGPDPAIAVVLTDTLPLSALLETATPSQGSCVGVVIVTCNLGSIASGGLVTVTVSVTPTAAGLMTNLANVTANDFDPALANNSATETTTVIALRRLYLPLVRS